MTTDDYFADWSASQLADRLLVLERYDRGWDNPATGELFYPMAFPSGRNPQVRPEDSTEAVSQALTARMPGVV